MEKDFTFFIALRDSISLLTNCITSLYNTLSKSLFSFLQNKKQTINLCKIIEQKVTDVITGFKARLVLLPYNLIGVKANTLRARYLRANMSISLTSICFFTFSLSFIISMTSLKQKLNFFNNFSMKLVPCRKGAPLVSRKEYVGSNSASHQKFATKNCSIRMIDVISDFVRKKAGHRN